jgi:hypothetical protein
MESSGSVFDRRRVVVATALDGTPEGSGTSLDNSLIVKGNDMSEDSFHSVSNIPFVLVGGARGALKTGCNVKLARQLGDEDRQLLVDWQYRCRAQ